jgi:hypothetical protein
MHIHIITQTGVLHSQAEDYVDACINAAQRANENGAIRDDEDGLRRRLRLNDEQIQCMYAAVISVLQPEVGDTDALHALERDALALSSRS